MRANRPPGKGLRPAVSIPAAGRPTVRVKPAMGAAREEGEEIMPNYVMAFRGQPGRVPGALEEQEWGLARPDQRVDQ